MDSVDIFITSFREPLEQSCFSTYLSWLPPDLRKKNSQFIRWQDKHAHLLGKLLLDKALRRYQIKNDIWSLIDYTPYKRPYLKIKEYDFNISHSGDFVICAIGKNMKLGIDIEKNQKRNFNNFRNIMTSNQWDEIKNSSCSIKTFYKYWTIKESVIKADGRGFFVPLDKLEVKNNTVLLDDKLWFVNNIKFIDGYSLSLTTSVIATYKIHEVNFYNPEMVR
ncbi:4'-phosphopantetheinyl transferase family protein [Aquimarina rhabdastrellae]